MEAEAKMAALMQEMLTSARKLTQAPGLQRALHAIKLPAYVSSSCVPNHTRDAADAIAPQEGQFLTGTYLNQSGERHYKLYIPAAYNGQSLPLIVMLHGCGQTADDFARGTRMNLLAQKTPCFVLYPEQSSQHNCSKCWNWFIGMDQRRGTGEAAIIAGLTTRIITEYQLDRSRVYVAGLSAGGAMAMNLATNYPDIFAAAGIHSGLAYGAAHDFPSALNAMKGAVCETHQRTGQSEFAPMPLIVFHGDEDNTVKVSNASRIIASHFSGLTAGVVQNLPALACGHAVSRTFYYDSFGAINAEQWIVHGGGHAWFGGSSEGTHTDPATPDASQEMMRFFATKTLVPGNRIATQPG